MCNAGSKVFVVAVSYNRKIFMTLTTNKKTQVSKQGKSLIKC